MQSVSSLTRQAVHGSTCRYLSSCRVTSLMCSSLSCLDQWSFFSSRSHLRDQDVSFPFPSPSDSFPVLVVLPARPVKICPFSPVFFLTCLSGSQRVEKTFNLYYCRRVLKPRLSWFFGSGTSSLRSHRHSEVHRLEK